MPASVSPSPALPITILLVEDDDVDVMNVRRLLRRSNASHPLLVARDGVEALALLGDAVPDRLVILLDLNMPRMSGLELLRTLKERAAGRAVPAVVLTTSGDERDRAEAERLDVAAYLVKPLTAEALMDILRLAERHWAAPNPP